MQKSRRGLRAVERVLLRLDERRRKVWHATSFEERQELDQAWWTVCQAWRSAADPFREAYRRTWFIHSWGDYYRPGEYLWPPNPIYPAIVAEWEQDHLARRQRVTAARVLEMPSRRPAPKKLAA